MLHLCNHFSEPTPEQIGCKGSATRLKKKEIERFFLFFFQMSGSKAAFRLPGVALPYYIMAFPELVLSFIRFGRSAFGSVPFLYFVPVDDLPKGGKVCGTAVLVVEVIGMFPHVESKQGREPLCHRVAGT